MAGWLVTGASGFLGANLGWALEGATTRIGVSRTAPPSGTFDVHVPLDITDAPSLRSVIESSRPSVIVHAAALSSHEACQSDPDHAHALNVTASRDLAAIAADAGSRFIYISSDAVFPGTRGNYVETDVPEPFSVYGETKLLGEVAVLAANPSAIVVRTNFFGWSPSGTRSILEFFVNELGAGHRVRGFTDFTTTSAYAPVLAETIDALVSMDAVGTFHVTSLDALTKYAFGVAVADEFGLASGLITPTTADIHPPRNGDISLDVSRVEAVLGRSLPTQIEGIRRAHTDASHLRELLRPIGSP